MIPVDGSYLYSLGQAIQPLRNIHNEETYLSAWYKFYLARIYLEGFISSSVFSSAIRIMVDPANTLISTLKDLEEKASDKKSQQDKLGHVVVNKVSNGLQEFESVFKAEFRYGNIFIATQKGVYDTRTLILNGERMFPKEFEEDFKEAAKDVNKGARCLAFELYTASGFHFHRANESVLLKYLESLGGEVPENRNMGEYIKTLGANRAPKRITSCLRDLKDMHRNPLMHPDQSIDSFDEADALLGAIRTAITAMVKEIKKSEDIKSS